jgi:hypothetical protein
MTSQSQILANRENGKNGGPNTVAGKAKVAANAVKHRLTAKKLLLADEDREEFAALQERIFEALKPVGPLEEMCVDFIVADAWRMYRAINLEAGALQDAIDHKLDYYSDCSPSAIMGHKED